MKIRAITIGTGFDLLEECLNKNVGGILKDEFEKEGIEVQTIRLCTPPFDIGSELTASEYFKNRNGILSSLDKACDDGILNYYSYEKSIRKNPNPCNRNFISCLLARCNKRV